MTFNSPESINSLIHQMRLADWKRSKNRQRINELFSGFPPFDDEYMSSNINNTNVNTLESCEVAHDARIQYNTALVAPDPRFTVTLDYGAKHKRQTRSDKITKKLARIIKKSAHFYELGRSVIASNIIHGIGPSIWEDKFHWAGEAIGVEDVLIPGNTILGFKNLPFYAIFRRYTGMQLRKMTSGPKCDPAWNMPVVDSAIEWLDKETAKLMGAAWPEVWSPEKMSERIKSDGGLYAGDAVPTIDCYDFYFWNDDDKVSGWNRRIILDAWGSQGFGGSGVGAFDNSPERKMGDVGKGEFLYNPGNRKYADKLSEMVHFQFADCSPVSPFRYHSVRSLGFLLYGVCHLQNRLRCKFTDSVFEAMMQYFRVGNPEDAERVMKINLIDKGVIANDVEFVKAQDRWQVPAGLAESAMTMNWQTIARNSASFAQTMDAGEQGQTQRSRETATLTMQRAQSTSTMITSMLTQAYTYEEFRYQEICRRFCIEDSEDPDVRKFRVECLKDDIPAEALNVDRWDISANRVMGGGNKMLQVAMADKLMAMRQVLDPDSQRKVDRIYVVANTDNYDLADDLVPEQKQVSQSALSAQNAAGTLLQGLPVGVETGINHIDYVEAMLSSMELVVNKVLQQGGVPSQDTLFGLENMAQHVEAHIQIIAQNKEEAQRVKQYTDVLGKMQNEMKAFSQRIQEQMQAQQQQNGNGGPDPETMAKIQGTIITAQAKAKNADDSHARKTAQRQITFEQKTAQDQVKSQLELQTQAAKDKLDLIKAAQHVQFESEKARLKSELPPEEQY